MIKENWFLINNSVQKKIYGTRTTAIQFPNAIWRYELKQLKLFLFDIPSFTHTDRESHLIIRFYTIGTILSETSVVRWIYRQNALKFSPGLKFSALS